ncbi:MAG: PHP domain-containing protein [Gammaproteobacteria bacterium]
MSNIDLHTHTDYSDGLLSPQALLERAQSRQISTLAITDHDSVYGVLDAMPIAKDYGITLIPGIEVSAQWEHISVHIVGLNIDPNNERLRKRLDNIIAERQERALKMASKLAKKNMPGFEAIVAKHPKVSFSRLHIAQWMVQEGYVDSLKKAFQQYLGTGRSAYASMSWMSLQEAIDLIHQAGGVAVIAHPRRYDIRFNRLSKLVAEFKTLGGDGIEIATCTQNDDDQRLLAGLARQYGLSASMGSDFHFPRGFGDLGAFRFCEELADILLILS